MLYNLFITIINTLIKALGTMGTAFVALLPNSPFQSFLDADIPYIETLNWVIPVQTFVTILSAWLVAIGLYYLVQVVLRWVKIIE